jgi:hypothetical protein
MAIKKRVSSGEAKRQFQLQNPKAQHPLLKLGSRTASVWQTIVQHGNPAGGISAANIAKHCVWYHPQVLADLQHAGLVTKIGKRNGHFMYVADPRGIGVVNQTVKITVELLERADGTFAVNTILHGAVASNAKIVRVLTTRNIFMDVPLPDANGVEVIVGDVATSSEDSLPTRPAKEEPLTLDTTYTIVEQ